MRVFITSAFALAAAACSSEKTDPYNIKPEEAPVLARMMAEEIVKPRLRDPESAVFSDLEIYSKTANRPIIICGKVNSRNALGGMTGPMRFIAGDSLTLEEQISAAEMDVMWLSECHP